MNSAESKKLISMSLLAWILFFIIYSMSKKHLVLDGYSGYLSFAGEVGLDLLIVYLLFYINKKIAKSNHKIIFRFLLFSYISAVFSDLIYNISINIYGIEYTNVLIVSLFDIPFALFLLFQLFSWILVININSGNSIKSREIIYLPNILLSVLLFLMFLFGIDWKIKYFSIIGFFQLLDTMLEVIGFASATICLTRAKHSCFKIILTGYLVIVSSDFIIRYSVVSGSTPYLSTFESTWVLGLVMIALGLKSYFSNMYEDILELLPKNSLQSQISIWSLILWLGLIFLFCGVYYIYTDTFVGWSYASSLLPILVPFSVITIIGSNFIAKRISFSLSTLENSINTFVSNGQISVFDLENQYRAEKNTDGPINQAKFQIDEVEILRNFIFKTVSDLTAANRVKAEFLMNMSHDFRTPVSGIYHLSKSIYKSMQDSNLKDLQKLIVDSSAQLMKYADEVLNHTKLSQNSLSVNVEKFSIQSLLNDVIMFLSAKIKEKNLKILTELPGKNMCYEGEYYSIHQVMLNIISNAIKFTEKGYIKITLKQIDLMIIIEVEDSGIGIEEKNHKIIFTSFSRVNSAETSKYPGIGLGLSNVKSILAKIGGQVSLQSSLDKGSKFTISLPILNR